MIRSSQRVLKLATAALVLGVATFTSSAHAVDVSASYRKNAERAFTAYMQGLWPEAKAFGSPGTVKFVARSSDRIPRRLNQLVIEEFQKHLPPSS